MCGICGYVGTEDARALRSMRDSMTHRGPDDAGLYSDSQVSLGHRRLSIIDLQQGSQPMHSADRSLVLVFNGEIYNYRSLRDQLTGRGCVFRTSSDTEAILHAYTAYGEHCPEHLDGMFSFVIYDRRRQCLFGARDRMGKKPLYFTRRPFRRDGGEIVFAFASELKAFRASPIIGPELEVSPEALVSYLLNDYVAGAQRIYRHVQLLGAGSAFTYGLPESKRPGLRSWQYWDISFDRAEWAQQFDPADEDAAQRQLLNLLRDAVQKRLVSDVPLGALLSGGIDSSAIVALMREFKPADRIETFTIGFGEGSFDETEHAELAAKHFGVRHYLRRFTAAEMANRLTQTVDLLDEPFADPSILPVSMLCQFARERVTVALAGDGGDELFAGYDPFRAVRPADWYSRLAPRWMHQRIVMPLSRCLPSSTRNMSLQFKVARFLRGATVDPKIRTAVWMGPFTVAQLARVAPGLTPWLDADQTYGPIFEAAEKAEFTGADTMEQTLDFFQRFYLTDDILVKADRASMMHSLEVRSPFLDTRLVEYANALPHSMKLRRGVTKYLLKAALLRRDGDGPLVPPSIVHRKKKGFGIPVAHWIRHEHRALFRETLVDDWPESELPMFDRSAIREMYAEHVGGGANRYKELWALFVLAQWSRRHLGETSMTERQSQEVVSIQSGRIN